MASIEPDASQIAWYSYDMGHGAGILVRQLCADLITGGPVKVFRKKATDDYTGWAVWGCSPLLGRLAIERPELFAGKEVLELGAGCGVAGLAVACCTGAASICLSDYPTETLRNTLHNVALNCERTAVASADTDVGITTVLGGETFSLGDSFIAPGTGCAVTLAQLDWELEATWPRADGEKEGEPRPSHRQFDILLAADLLPREEYGTKVAFVARHLLRPGGIIIAVSPAARYGFVTLEEGLRGAGFVTTHCRGVREASLDSLSDSEPTSHEVIPDEWRRNPLRQPLSEYTHGDTFSGVQVCAAEAIAAMATGSPSTAGGSGPVAELGMSPAAATVLAEAVASGAASSAACPPSECSHPSSFGGPARVPPLPPSDSAQGRAAAAAAAATLVAALRKAGGTGALRLVPAADAADMFPELVRPDYDILAAAFRAPLSPPA